MAEPLIQANAPPVSRAKLACHLRKKTTGRAASRATAGEVELENISTEVLEIEYRMSFIQYLNVIVTDSRGHVLSEGHYGDIFSPMEKPDVWRLQPGEKFIHPVSLTGKVPRDKLPPGEYTVRAVYEYNGLRAVSEPYHLQLKGDDL
jgi:hypothetical protein